ncbi:hypothetical protein [Mixta intestinalis]|uniref:Uncharacterized protein n=1 Tax=Mixta intestinalis TaxID=1615494 RepID=A0A6P1PYT4_9GAMM|nr:hypothetical protein [Mixta intestinalis]QHM71262.1 hypothetical protein C7M51_01548 [Mixta intestinalis]
MNGFSEQAGEAVRDVLGDAVYALLAAGRPVSNEALAAVITEQYAAEPDLAAELALDLLDSSST